ncbi:MAG: ATP-binding protein [Gillisia sp.]
MNWRYFISLIILLSGWCKAGAQELPLTHFTSDSEVNALPSALVTNIYQDRMGFMWFTVFTSGLVRYDGSNMELYDQSHGLRDLGVWQMLEDGKGHLWVSSISGLVVSEKPLHMYTGGKKVKFTPMYRGTLLTREAVSRNQQLAVDNRGRIWTGLADKGIIRYYINKEGKISTDTISTAVNSKNNRRVNSLRSTLDGGMLAGLEGGILAEFREGKARALYGAGTATENENFNALYEDDSGGIWAYRQNGEILHFRTKNAPPEIILGGLPSNVTGITSLRDGTVLASNRESGIIRIDPETGAITASYTRANGLLSDNVFHVLEDLEGNVWIAQSGGISKLRYNFSAFENFTARSISGEKPVLPSGKINTVLVPTFTGSPCRFWVGTEGGSTCVNEYGASKFITQADGLLGDWVNGLASDEKGRIWIATTRGLNVLVFEKNLIIDEAFNVREINVFGKDAYLYSLWDSPPFIASENLRIKDRSGNNFSESLWFPGLRSLYVFAGGKIYKLGPDTGLPPTLYKSVALDETGQLWVGTLDRGLYKSTVSIDIERLDEISNSARAVFEQVWSLDKGSPTNHIEKLLWHRNRLWAGTQQGLFILDPATTKVLDHINRAKGLPADNAVSFALSPVTNTFWVGTNKGLAQVSPETGEVLKVVNRQAGLVDNEVWLYGSVKVDKAGKVYYGTSNGLSIYDPSKDKPNTVPPQLQLTSAEITYKSDSRNEAIFEYTALSFANVAGVKYKTRLKGYDETWSQLSSEKRLRYTNLPAYLWSKEYTLEIMAINESGVQATEPLVYKFHVRPVWWLQWWAFLFYFLLAGVLVFVIDRIQRRRLIKRERDNAKLREAKLQAETAIARSNAAESRALVLKAENEKKAIELEKARELERAYNELKTTQKQLIQAEKMASLGRLATGVAHEIKNPLNFINNFAELSVDLVVELEEARKNGDEEEIGMIMQDLKQNTSKIEEHGKRADAIVRSMMQHARGGKPIFELFDLNDLIVKYTELAFNGKRTQHPGFNVIIEKELDKSLGMVKIVGQEIGQVLLNIIGNSLDAALEKKNKQGDSYEPRLKISSHNAGDFAEITIEDNGPGVPEEIRERIFEPFFTTKPTGEGTGLGLSLSYNIITQGHNGSLKLLNNRGEGATFLISLPILREDLPNPETKEEVQVDKV